MERAMRVPDFLSEQRIPFDTLIHPPAFTAQKRASFLHVSGKRLAKSVLLAGASGYVLAVLPATLYVDPQLVARELGETVRLAEPREVAERFTDCEWGALTPFGTLYGLSTILDEAITPEELIVFEAHGHGLAIRMRCQDFEILEKPKRFRFARPNLPQGGSPPSNARNFPSR
jgi:Ala-tRNA(Pro) deacylase